MKNRLNELIEGCKLKDRKAQEIVFKSYYGVFIKICMRYAPDKQTANAILNDSFLKVFTRIERYSGTGSFEGWMRKVVVHTCLSYVRDSEKGNQHFASQGDFDSSVLNNGTIDNEALSRLGVLELSQLIQCLPRVSRTVFNLYVFEGYSHKEIGKAIGISEGTSYWHLNYARQFLRSKIKCSNDDR